jgi:glycosyltransferase involved in cell wall biosynthesis
MCARIAMHAAGRLVQGNERQLELIARGLLERGHELYVSAEPGTDTASLLAATGAHMSAARPRGMADVVSALRFGRWLAEVRPEAVLLSSWRRMWIAARTARAAGVPRIVQRVGMTHQIPRGWRGAHYRHALRSLVDLIYANSEDVRSSLLSQLPDLDASRVRVQPNALAPMHVTARGVRAELGIPDGARLIAAVGGLSRRKGFDLLIRAVATLPPSTHLVICGQGAERQALESLAAEMGAASRVCFAGQRNDVPAILAESDVFAMCSRAEGLSVAMLEAMRAGLPVIATAVAGAEEALGARGGQAAGWIVPPEDSAALASALREVLATLDAKETRRRTGEAQRRVAEHYSTERLIDGVEHMLLPGSPQHT